MKFKKSEYGRYVELMFLDYADSDVVPVENLRLMSVKIQRFCPPLAFRTELRLVSQGRNFMCKSRQKGFPAEWLCGLKLRDIKDPMHKKFQFFSCHPQLSGFKFPCDSRGALCLAVSRRIMGQNGRHTIDQKCSFFLRQNREHHENHKEI